MTELLGAEAPMAETAAPMIDPRVLLRYGTTTVGVITAVGPRGVNVMAAEWTYLVARQPPHFAVGLQTTNYSTRLVLERREFGLTLCDASMASLANFAGSFSGADVDKSRVSGVDLRDPVATTTPTVVGGSLSAECRVVHVVDLPGYALVVGEARWLHVDLAANDDPLVKHGGMHRLGEPIRSAEVTAAATRRADGSVRVCASAQGVSGEALWSVTDVDGVVLRAEVAGEDLDVVVSVPPGADALVVARADCRSTRVVLPAR
jgi:flavin reductase (DIM6/NTAB) family NADH-FMN oxidoreductase RutF